MNHQQQQYLDSQQSPMSAGQSYAPQSTTAGGLPHYPQYQQAQPPVLQPAPGNYSHSPGPFGQHYSLGNGMTPPHGAGQPVSASMASHMNPGLPPLPTMAAGGSGNTYVGAPTGPPPSYQHQSPDPTGQVAPTGMKPRVTATLWEDEGCMCFQVEAKGVCVARRDDNHMINGTKLLNVAGMTRGRRDGILKSEKTRNVVKIGPMHLKGVWIPFDRALDFANKEKITEGLYPLFVHNIGALLYHPTNSNRTNAVMAAADRRRLDTKQQGGMIGPSGSQPPSLTHHHTMNSSIGTPHSIAPSPGAGRPMLDRAHTFPTPPTSASGQIAGLAHQGNSYDWGGGNVGGGAPHGGHPLMLDNHAHSTPATPATTPPGSSLPSLQPYQSHQSYETPRQMYSSAASQQTQYATQPQTMTRGGAYTKQEMGPPSSHGPGSRPESEHGDSKMYVQNQGNEHVGHGTGDEEAEHEQDSDYPHDNSHAYSAQRGPYDTIASTSILGSSEMNGIPAHQSGPGHITPRATPGNHPQWTAAGYQTPPRAAPSSHLYNPTSDARGTLPNGSSAAENYTPGPYAPTQTNGVTPQSSKRSRDDEEDRSRSTIHGDDVDAVKRRKMGREGSSNGSLNNGSFENDGRQPNRARNSISSRSRR